jgi:aminoglycoside phosphotransferase (APT) family kinase protein
MSNVDPINTIRTHFPELPFGVVRVIDDGWDSLVLDLDDEWIVRFPRRPEAEQSLEREIAFLPELAMRLPVAVPRFELIARNGIVCVAYRKLAGSPATVEPTDRTAQDIGRFLAALHGFPLDRARALGIPSFNPAAWRGQFGDLCAGFRRGVFPLLRNEERKRADEIFARVEELEFDPVLIHGDLGPEHILCRDSQVVAVIDWSDARVGDAALDLAWCLNSTPSSFADSVARAYGDADLRKRSLFYHQIGPWYEVVYGIETGRERFVASGLEGVRARLPRAEDPRL